MAVNVIIDEIPFDTATDHPSKEKILLPPDKKFHIFFSYRDVHRDKLWVKKVISKLEIEHGYTCCDHERDFLPGTKIIDNIKDGVKNSEKVVVVFSKEAIDSHYVLLEAEMAHRLSLERRKNLLLPVLLDDCDVPEEFKLLTYIDAREGVEETTWWPKLLKSIESRGETSRSPYQVEEKSVAVSRTFSVNQLCSTETNYSCLQCSIHANSKYVPEELRPEAIGVPVDLSRATYKDLLQSPRVVWRQKCCCFATIWVVFGSLGFVVLSMYFCVFIISGCNNPLEETITSACIAYGTLLYLLLIACALGCFFGYKKCYLKNPNSVRKNIIEHNRNLSKYGVMVTIAHGCLWRKASIIFYKCRFELCKEYVIRHLVEEEGTGTTEHRDIPDSDQMVAANNDSPPLSGIEEPPCVREQSMQNVNAIDPVEPEEAEGVADVADDEPLLWIQETENLDYENKALNLLLSCTPEYFELAYANQLNKHKEDRHGIDIMCLCQYLEKANKDFRNKVKRTKSLRRKSGIEENDPDENNKHLKNVLVY